MNGNYNLSKRLENVENQHRLKSKLLHNDVYINNQHLSNDNEKNNN